MATKARKRSAAKKKASKKGYAGIVKSAAKSKTVSAKKKGLLSVQRGAASTAPVVYQTLRERIDAVDKNVGSTENLSDFLASTGW